MKLPRGLLLVGLGVPLVGCFTPAPVVRLHPRSADVVWLSGRAIVTETRPEYRLAVAFDHLAEGNVAMRVEVQNVSNARLDVDPARVRYRTCSAPKLCSVSRRVVNPEEALLALDRAQADERASQANSAVAGTVLILLSATATVAAAADGNPRAARAAAFNGAVAADISRSAIERSEQRVWGIDAEKINWSTQALRRTTLFPGQGIAGYVYLPIDATATSVWLGAQIAQEEIWIPFQQVVASPPPTLRPELQSRNVY